MRRLTRSPSTSQLSDSDINDYINTFLLYDVPEHLRLFEFRKTLTFYTQPNIDQYSQDTTNANAPLYDFNNRYITVHEPAYVAGYRAFFSQSRDQFFNWYPFTNYDETIGGGDGITTHFTGTLTNIPILPFGNLTIGMTDTTGKVWALSDTTVSATLGNIYDTVSGTNYGTINYVTGAFDITFGAAPAATSDITADYAPYQAARPQSILYFNDTFTLRPVPDQVYPVNIEVYIRPTTLISDTDTPQLEQWWQWIAYGAAKKVFEDRLDTESIAQIMIEYKNQERMVLRRTIVEQTKERVATIYTEQNNGGIFGPGWWYGPF